MACDDDDDDGKVEEEEEEEDEGGKGGKREAIRPTLLKILSVGSTWGLHYPTYGCNLVVSASR